jgi:hypothetical protein
MQTGFSAAASAGARASDLRARNCGRFASSVDSIHVFTRMLPQSVWR